MTTFKPGAKVLVSIPCSIDSYGKLEPVATERVWRIAGDPITPADAERIYGATVLSLAEPGAAPATGPYTPRDGDEVEIDREPLRGRVHVRDDGKAWVVDARGGIYIDVFDKALAERRVRLIKAAPPVYVPGRIYRSEGTGDTFIRRTPSESGRCSRPFVWMEVPSGDLKTAAEVPADVVLMDLVPAEVSS